MENNSIFLEKDWWKKAVIYQIYPRSFQDSNGDGIGDIPGILRRLDYLADLGIDAIWLSPVYQSPQDDNGYDISDYEKIDPMFGTMEDMDQLIAKAKEKNIRIIMDLVLNHTSDEHTWFLEAKKSRDNPYHDYYIWRDGEPGKMPNEMRAVFGGPAWEWVPEVGQYYLHQFTVKQPDLNWENPKVRQELYKMINWWIDKGVGGFRLDTVDLFGKKPDEMITHNGPLLHDYLKEMSRESYGRKPLITVGEAGGADVENARLYSNPDGSELSMVFQFEAMLLDEQGGKEKWDLSPLPFRQMKDVFNRWQTGLYEKGWNSLFWENHDIPRIISRWGNDKEYREKSAKMLATLLHGMQGTPYIYQGEELGMTNTAYDISEYRDIETLNMYKERKEKGVPENEIMASIHAKSRDNARSPMQWDTSPNAGFTSGIPWMKVNPNYTEINGEAALKDPDSIFHYYQKLIQLRKQYDVFTDGKFEMLLPEDESIFAYKRGHNEGCLTVFCNFYGETVECPMEACNGAQLLISNYSDSDSMTSLRPYEARIYYQ